MNALLPLLPIILYAETHYRFKYFFSFLKKNEPEILADLPHRIDPGGPLPILLLVKDAHLFPAHLHSVKIKFSAGGKRAVEKTHEINAPLQAGDRLWWKVLNIPFENELSEFVGPMEIDVHFHYSCSGKHLSCVNDNYRTSSKKSFRLYRAAEPLPSLPGWIQGDTHTHSSYTNDQVEFGAPLAPSVELCKAMGLNFFCVTDHSYDLDDSIDSYLINDRELPKWNSLQREVETINALHDNFTILRGEEVSCWNREGRNVHLLLWGTRRFHSGSGDSAEKWFHTRSEHTIREILKAIDPSVAACAGHPTEAAPFFQRMLIKRGEWSLADMNEERLIGIQILNGEYGKAFERGIESWRKLLLLGKRISIAAGNDAHGNFNRFRQIGIPFFTIREHHKQLFGKMRTAVRCSSVSEESVLDALRNGRSLVTGGPLATLDLLDNAGGSFQIGDSAKALQGILTIRGASTKEYGPFSEVKIYLGRIAMGKESVLFSRRIPNHYSLSFALPFELPAQNVPYYVRLEASTANGYYQRTETCLTNPLWIDKP